MMIIFVIMFVFINPSIHHTLCHVRTLPPHSGWPLPTNSQSCCHPPSHKWQGNVALALSCLYNWPLCCQRWLTGSRLRDAFTVYFHSPQGSLLNLNSIAKGLSWGQISGPRLNIKTVFPKHGDSHVKDKTVGETVLSLTWESLYW